MAAKARRKTAPLQGAERALRRAAVFVSEGGEFRLAVALFPHPVRQQHWIQVLTAEAEKERVHLTVCPVPAEGEPRVFELLTAHLLEVPTLAGHTRAVIVTGIPPHLPDASSSRLDAAPRPRMAGELNLDRERFERHCPCPVILALTITAHSQLLRHAPDLMHWCSQTFDFEEPLSPGDSPPTRGIMELQSAMPGEVYANLSELQRAESVFRGGLASAISAHGSDSSHTIQVRANLANVLDQMGRTAEALSLSRENLCIAETTPGYPEQGLALPLNQLAHHLHHAGRLSEAEPLMRRALAIGEATLGKDHPTVSSFLGNLAQLLQATNRLVEAEPLLRRALAIDEASLGKDHPDLAIRLNNLAQLLQATNRLAEAESLMRRVLAISEDSLGKDHPNVAASLSNLAQLLQDTGRLAEAEPLMRRALAIFETSLGKRHPKVAFSLNNLATLLKATNRPAEAEPLMRMALAIDEASLGRFHPSVAIDLNNLATLLQDTNRLTEAEPLLRRALAINEAVFGKVHYSVAKNLNNLATLLHDTNRLTEAEPLLRRALEIDVASYGNEHPEVARDLNNLARLLQDTSRLAEAEPLMRRAVEILVSFTVDTGHSHPQLLMVIKNYGGLLMEIGDTESQIIAKLDKILEPIQKLKKP